MAICDDRGEADGREIVVAPSGIPKMYSNDIGLQAIDLAVTAQ